MYCRECGNQIPDNSISCNKCGTRKGIGVSFCQMCGFHTSEKMEYCLNCGAKLQNVMSQKMKNTRLAELQKKVKSTKKMNNILKFICIGSAVVTVLLILVLVLRPEPSNIPDPRKSDEFLRVGNTYYYDSSYVSEEVAEYWVQGRALISYIICTVFIFIVTLVNKALCKKKYINLLKALKEAKNVL